MCFFSVSIACFTTELMSKLIQCTFLRQLHKFSRAHWLIFIVNKQIHEFIIQQIVTLSKYGHDALDICHP